jgi:hypothetical protein
MYIEELDDLACYVWRFLGDDRARTRYYLTDRDLVVEYAGWIHESEILWNAWLERREEIWEDMRQESDICRHLGIAFDHSGHYWALGINCVCMRCVDFLEDTMVVEPTLSPPWVLGRTSPFRVASVSRTPWWA